MELLNATRLKVAYNMGLRPDGSESMVVVAKGTFGFPVPSNLIPVLLADQAELVMSDRFSGEPGHTAPIYESDFAPYKRRCDVLLDGSAHAPSGRPCLRVQVGLRVGGMTKSFDVVGDRRWRAGLFGVSASEPEPFAAIPISYNRAFGGSDHSHPDPRLHAALMENPVGSGFHVNLAPQAVEGKPLPNTEEAGHPVVRPNGRYRPMAFGPVARGWSPRLGYAGTYDRHWIDNVFPFLPEDFDERHFQSAPVDQQIDYPRGGEDVVMVNLTPEGRTHLKLPPVDLPVTFYPKPRGEEVKQAVVDTIFIEPDLRRLTMVWRASMPLRRNMFEIDRVVVGTMPPAWHRARQAGKTWYPSLRELVAEGRTAKEEAGG